MNITLIKKQRMILQIQNTDTVYEDVTRSVKIKVADMPPLGAGSDE